MRFLPFVFALLVLGGGASAQPSDPVEKYYNKLKDKEMPLGNHGAVCEHVAREQLLARFDPELYDVTIGIVYRDHERVVGELDLVVFRSADHEALFIVEVKCQVDLSRALRKATVQLERFEDYRDEDLIETMHAATDSSELFYQDQFDEDPITVSMSQKGGQSQGFDWELELTLAQVHRLHRRLQAAQN